MPKSLGKKINPTSGRRLVIADIHGCYATLNALLKRLEIQKSDQVFFLGDYINKGPKNRETLDLVLHLNSISNYFALIGNHDELLLQYLQSNSPDLQIKLKELENLEFFDLQDSEKHFYINQLENLPVFFDLEDFLLVHAGFDFGLINPFEARANMLNIRAFAYDAEKAGGKTIIHGHYPHELAVIKKAIANQDKIIPLDNGCVYRGIREDMGALMCLDLDTKELHSQPKLD